VARCTLVLRFSTFFTPIFKAPGCSVSNDPPPSKSGADFPICPDFVPRFVGYLALLIIDST
jgi:hypothetical protein